MSRDSPEDEGVELPDDDHFEQVVDAIVEGELVPFLGAGASLCDRPHDASWKPGENRYFPSATELARHLAERFSYPASEHEPELVRVSQYAALERGTHHLTSGSGRYSTPTTRRRRCTSSSRGCLRCCAPTVRGGIS